MGKYQSQSPEQAVAAFWEKGKMITQELNK